MKTIKLLFSAFSFSLFAFIFTLSASAQKYPEMVLVQGGTFTMGDAEDEGGKAERPAHKVTLTTFSIAKTETTVGQYKAYLLATGKKLAKEHQDLDDRYPVYFITSADAEGYCDWLSDQTGHIYRLPTEAEWEYAARGGKLSKGFRYSGAQTLDLVAWHDKNSAGYLHFVATKKANELGLYDMTGNVSEICKDNYRKYTSDPQTNPKGKTDYERQVVRGGNRSSMAWQCTVSYRNINDDAQVDNSVTTLLDDLLAGLESKNTKDDKTVGTNKAYGYRGFRVVMVK